METHETMVTNVALETGSRLKGIVYWVTTAVITLQSAAGAYLDLSGNENFINVFTALGYPLYLLTILGVGRILAAVALIVPGFSRLKEWAYAGLVFDFTGAGASHLFIGDGKGAVFPFVFAGITLASWALRPPGRKL